MPVFEAADALELCLAATAGMVRDMRPDTRATARSRADAASAPRPTSPIGWCASLACRSARRITSPARSSSAPRRCGCDLAELPLAEMQAVEPAITAAVYDVLDCRALGREPHQLRRHRARQRRRAAASAAAILKAARTARDSLPSRSKRARFPASRADGALASVLRSRCWRSPAAARRATRSRRPASPTPIPGPIRSDLSMLFAYRDGELTPRASRSRASPTAVGTPFYVYSAASLARALPRLCRGLRADAAARSAIAVKANSEPRRARAASPARRRRRCRLGGRVAPRARRRHPAAAHHLFRRRQDRDELEAALAAGIHQINVEVGPGTARLSAVAQRAAPTAPVAIRVNPDVDALTHAKISTGKKENKFGIDIDDARRRLRPRRAAARHRAGRARRAYRLAADRSCAVRAGLSRASPSCVVELRARRLRRRRGSISAAGSASAITPRTRRQPEPTPRWSREIFGTLGVELAFEPGRVLCGPAGVLVARVVYVKDGATAALRHHRRGDERSDPAGALRCLARHRAGAAAGAGRGAGAGRCGRPGLRDRRHLRHRARAAAARRRRPGRVDRRRRLWRGDELDLQQPAAGARGAGLRRPFCGDPGAAELSRRCLAMDRIPRMARRDRRPRPRRRRGCRDDRMPTPPFRTGRRLALRGCGSPARRCCGSGCGRRCGRRSALLGVFAVARAVRPAAALPGCRACRDPGAVRGRVRRGDALGLRGVRRGALARAARGAAPHRAGERPAAPSAAALADRPSAPLDAGRAALWAAHQRRMAAAVRRLRVGWPVAGLSRRDPVGPALDPGDPAAARRGRCRRRLARSRSSRAFTPSFAAARRRRGQLRPLGDAARIYRARRRNSCAPSGQTARSVPTGSALLAQVHGGGDVPRLAIDGDGAAISSAIDKQNFRHRATLTAGKQLAVSQGGTMLGSWPIEIVPDNPPTIAFAKPPQGHPRARRCASITGRATITASRASRRSSAGSTIRPRRRRSNSSCRCPALHLKEPRRPAITI